MLSYLTTMRSQNGHMTTPAISLPRRASYLSSDYLYRNDGYMRKTLLLGREEFVTRGASRAYKYLRHERESLELSVIGQAINPIKYYYFAEVLVDCPSSY